MKRVDKGWGFETWVENNNLYCGKFLHVNKDKECSVHYHKDKHETFHILEGEVLFRHWRIPHKLRDKEPEYLERYWLGTYTETILREGDTFILPQYLAHQFRGIEDSTIIEFSTTHRDEDSFRIIIGDILDD